MNKFLVFVVVSLIIIAEIAINNKNSMQNNQKTYLIPDTSFSIVGNIPEFKRILKPGQNLNTFIIELPNNQHLITTFSWLVIPKPTATQEIGSTYLYADQKFAPTPIKLNYYLPDGILDGKIYQSPIHSEPKNMIEINNAEDFKKIKILPGFENAIYQEE